LFSLPPSLKNTQHDIPTTTQMKALLFLIALIPLVLGNVASADSFSNNDHHARSERADDYLGSSINYGVNGFGSGSPFGYTNLQGGFQNGLHTGLGYPGGGPAGFGGGHGHLGGNPGFGGPGFPGPSGPAGFGGGHGHLGGNPGFGGGPGGRPGGSPGFGGQHFRSERDAQDPRLYPFDLSGYGYGYPYGPGYGYPYGPGYGYPYGPGYGYGDPYSGFLKRDQRDASNGNEQSRFFPYGYGGPYGPYGAPYGPYGPYSPFDDDFYDDDYDFRSEDSTKSNESRYYLPYYDPYGIYGTYPYGYGYGYFK